MIQSLRKAISTILIALCLPLFSGCTVLLVDQANQYNKSQKFAVPTSQQAKLDVPFIEQEQNFCGPASLAMVANYHGAHTTQQDLADLTFIPDEEGSLQVSMVAATRSLHLVPFTLQPSVTQLVLEVQAGHPVIILQNLGIRFYPRWHYSVVVGYNTDAKTFLLHSGPHEYLEVSMDKLQRTHDRAQRWALVALPIGELPTTAQPQDVVKAATDLENIGSYRLAQQTFLAGSQRWPEDFALQLGLANTFMQLEQPLNASKAYRRALDLNRHSAEALNNFAYSLFSLGCEQTALVAAQCAIELDRTNNASISSTLDELQQRTTHPRDLGQCPHIACDVTNTKPDSPRELTGGYDQSENNS